jgi:hypothetical protein
MATIQDTVASVKGPGFAHSPSRLLIMPDGYGYVFTHRGDPVKVFSTEDMTGNIRRGSVTTDDGAIRWHAVHPGCSYKLAKCRISTKELVALLDDYEHEDESGNGEESEDDLEAVQTESGNEEESEDDLEAVQEDAFSDDFAEDGSDDLEDDEVAWDAEQEWENDDEEMLAPFGVVQHGSYGPDED